ncbi:hypothetical protein PFTANZ_00958 [Plasmodium falciparum Tanzania (2000708)]|uniref:Uncharacterized protein n=1 Tax=Plasmodium falciparum Tanzania (2000708) TaxID=1036725 RepID=A0A024WD86_PLAFA|nr:hypothetical protein PFTANZ_00958 [Plasmodium falciparum Tanzania (2000708)]
MNMFLNNYKLKKGKGNCKNLSSVKKRRKKKKIIQNDYIRIINAEKEYVQKYHEDKIFLDNIKNVSSCELIKDCSYSVFFYNLFIKGLYLNKQNLEHATEKEHIQKNITKNITKNELHINKTSEHVSNITKLKKNYNKHNVILFKGKYTRQLICDYLKFLLNSIQNEHTIKAHFYILDYVNDLENKKKEMAKKIKMESFIFTNSNEEDKLCKDIILNCNILNEQKEDDNKSDNPLYSNNNTLKEQNTSTPLPSHEIQTESMNSPNLLNVKNMNQTKDDNGCTKEEIIKSNNLMKTYDIKINEHIYNKILNNFISELKSFFFSILEKIRSSKLLLRFIVTFSKICLILTPHYVNIINFIEILCDFGHIIPIHYISHFIHFFQCNKNIFIQKYKEFQHCIINNDPIKIQSVGARLIGFIKILQKKIHLNNNEQSMYSFFLNLLLSECLPINHLGFCNRQSAKNNFHYFFQESLDCCYKKFKEEQILYDNFELNIQNNIKNYKKIKTIIEHEIELNSDKYLIKEEDENFISAKNVISDEQDGEDTLYKKRKREEFKETSLKKVKIKKEKIKIVSYLHNS